MTPDVVLLTTSEVALLFRVAESTVRRWADDGTLPPARAPGRNKRFRREDVEALLESVPPVAGGVPVSQLIPTEPAEAPGGGR